MADPWPMYLYADEIAFGRVLGQRRQRSTIAKSYF
jgi:hypothetical protein